MKNYWILKNPIDEINVSDQKYNALLTLAAKSQPTPHQSNYFVRGAAMTKSGKTFSGSNHEYGITQAIH